MVDIKLDPNLTIAIETDDDEWKYWVAVGNGSEIVTQYGTNTDPRTASGRIMLRNIIRQHANEYTKEQVEDLLNCAFQEYKYELNDELE